MRIMGCFSRWMGRFIFGWKLTGRVGRAGKRISGENGREKREGNGRGKRARTRGTATAPEVRPPGPTGNEFVMLYQTRQLSSGTMGDPFLQPKAAAKAGWLTMAPLARKWSGEWGSVSTCARTASGREFSHQFCAKAM